MRGKIYKIINKNKYMIMAIIIMLMIINNFVLIKEGLSEEEEKNKEFNKEVSTANIRALEMISNKANKIINQIENAVEISDKERQLAINILNKGIYLCDIYLEASILRFGAETNEKARERIYKSAKELNANKKANDDGWFQNLFDYFHIGSFAFNSTAADKDQTSVIYQFRKKFIIWRDIISKKESSNVKTGSNKKTDDSNKEKKDDGGWF